MQKCFCQFGEWLTKFFLLYMVKTVTFFMSCVLYEQLYYDTVFQ